MAQTNDRLLGDAGSEAKFDAVLEDHFDPKKSLHTSRP